MISAKCVRLSENEWVRQTVWETALFRLCMKFFSIPKFVFNQHLQEEMRFFGKAKIWKNVVFFLNCGAMEKIDCNSCQWTVSSKPFRMSNLFLNRIKITYVAMMSREVYGMRIILEVDMTNYSLELQQETVSL